MNQSDILALADNHCGGCQQRERANGEPDYFIWEFTEEALTAFAAALAGSVPTIEQIELHKLKAGDCPPQSEVVLVSSVKRLMAASSPPAPIAAPAVALPAEPARNCCISWNGFNVSGDRKSIDEVRAAIHAKGSTVPALRQIILDERARSNAAPAAQAERPEPAEPVALPVCPTCGESEPFTGTCGTSRSDTRAFCNVSDTQAALAAKGQEMTPQDPIAELMRLADDYATVKFVEGVDGCESLVDESRAAIEAHARKMVDEVERLRKDALRLDHMQSRGATVEVVPGIGESTPSWLFRVGGLYKSSRSSIRDAIDAAIQESQS